LDRAFWTGDLTFKAAEAALEADFEALALIGAISSDSYYYEDSWALIFAGTIGFWAGDLAFTTFLGFYSELYSSCEDSFLRTFLAGTVTFWIGDLALTTFFGFSSLYYSEDSSCLTTFLGAGTGFLVTAI